MARCPTWTEGEERRSSIGTRCVLEHGHTGGCDMQPWPEKPKSMIAACVLSDLGELLAYTTQSTMSRCEEYAAETLPAWERMKELGAKVVQVEIKVVG